MDRPHRPQPDPLLSARFVESLRASEPDRAVLARAGDPDPAGAAAAFERASRHPDLAGQLERWAPPLLLGARPGFAAGCLEELANVRRAEGAFLDLAEMPALPGVLAASNFLARTLLRRPEWLEELRGVPPGPPAPVQGDWDAIRSGKYRGLLRVAARDLMGRPFAESLRELSDLADHCLDAALGQAALEAEVTPPALLALGKLGGAELNFSSDVDLIFVYATPAEDDLEHNAAVSRLIRQLKTGLERQTPDGFGYRVDLDLRPEGTQGALANSANAALGYYESFGKDWERQALIRLRRVAGPADVAEAVCEGLLPFVYRRSLDPGVLDAVRVMKLRIEQERRASGRDLEMDLKEGPGGIRDVEFLTQSLQLLLGGRHPELRTGNVLLALAALGRLGALPAATADALTDGYLWLRRAEHCLQLVEEQQTAMFPRNAEPQRALARRMGYADEEGEAARISMLEDWTAVRGQVRAHFDELVISEAE